MDPAGRALPGVLQVEGHALEGQHGVDVLDLDALRHRHRGRGVVEDAAHAAIDEVCNDRFGRVGRYRDDADVDGALLEVGAQAGDWLYDEAADGLADHAGV